MQPREAVLSTPELLSVIFSALPPDSRLLCREVCTLWRRVLRDRKLWAVLDFSDADYELDEALLIAAAAAAGANGVHTLVLSNPEFRFWDEPCNPDSDLEPVLLRVLRDNEGSLRRFNTFGRHDFSDGSSFDGVMVAEQLAAVLEAAPALELLEAHASAFSAASLLPILRDDRVRLNSLSLTENEGSLSGPSMHELVAALARQRRTLRSLELEGVPSSLAPDALVAVLLDCPLLVRLEIGYAPISSDLLAALGRLLGAGLLQDFTITLYDTALHHLWTSQAALAFAAGLRANRQLTYLSFTNMGLFEARQGNVGAEATILMSLVAHPSLKTVDVADIAHRDKPAPAYVSTWLSAMVAANSPSLSQLYAPHLTLSDADMLPFFSALSCNTHLTCIHAPGRRLSLGYLRDVVLPAVKANTSLEELRVPDDFHSSPTSCFPVGHRGDMSRLDFIAQVEALVNGRV